MDEENGGFDPDLDTLDEFERMLKGSVMDASRLEESISRGHAYLEGLRRDCHALEKDLDAEEDALADDEFTAKRMFLSEEERAFLDTGEGQDEVVNRVLDVALSGATGGDEACPEADKAQLLAEKCERLKATLELRTAENLEMKYNTRKAKEAVDEEKALTAEFADMVEALTKTEETFKRAMGSFTSAAALQQEAITRMEILEEAMTSQAANEPDDWELLIPATVEQDLDGVNPYPVAIPLPSPFDPSDLRVGQGIVQEAVKTLDEHPVVVDDEDAPGDTAMASGDQLSGDYADMNPAEIPRAVLRDLSTAITELDTEFDRFKRDFENKLKKLMLDSAESAHHAVMDEPSVQSMVPMDNDVLKLIGASSDGDALSTPEVIPTGDKHGERSIVFNMGEILEDAGPDSFPQQLMHPVRTDGLKVDEDDARQDRPSQTVDESVDANNHAPVTGALPAGDSHHLNASMDEAKPADISMNGDDDDDDDPDLFAD